LWVMHANDHHVPLCTLELVAEGHAERCPGTDCSFWEDGCALARVEHELDGRPALAAVLLDLRRRLDEGEAIELAEARSLFARRLSAGRE
jgi:hypothetical protein